MFILENILINLAMKRLPEFHELSMTRPPGWCSRKPVVASYRVYAKPCDSPIFFPVAQVDDVPQGQKVNVTGIPTPESKSKLITYRYRQPTQGFFPSPRMLMVVTWNSQKPASSLVYRPESWKSGWNSAWYSATWR